MARAPTDRTGKAMTDAFLAPVALAGVGCRLLAPDSLFFRDNAHPADTSTERISAPRIDPPSPKPGS